MWAPRAGTRRALGEFTSPSKVQFISGCSIRVRAMACSRKSLMDSRGEPGGAAAEYSARSNCRVVQSSARSSGNCGTVALLKVMARASARRIGVSPGAAGACAAAPVARRCCTSASWMRPSGPEPVNSRRSSPCSAASRRATGELRRRSSACAVAARGATGAGWCAPASSRGADAAAGVGEAEASPLSTQAIRSPTSACWSTCTRISWSRPLTAASISTIDFSVSTSSSGSPAST